MKDKVFRFLVKTLMVVGVMCVSFPLFAQRGVSVKVELKDNSDATVPYATVSLTEEGSDSPYKYALSDSEGKAEIQGVKNGSFILKVELMGYKTVETKVKVEGKAVDLGTVRMAEDAEVLDAASVTALGNPIVIKKDTIEYTASSFKTSDNDMLEELLKKLPGVEVSSDGSVTANGETINKITIDGKTFFLDDPQLATKNIPAKIVEKVKVVERKSDQAQFTGIDDGEEETIIDLTIHKGMMNGLFGNVMAGGGHDLPESGYYTGGNGWQNDGWRYQGAAMLGHFSDNAQLSLILNGNNTNNRGFNDMAGSMMQAMRGSRGMGRGMGGWGANNGITTSWMCGLNGAFTLFDGDMDLAGNYLYNGSSRYVEETSSRTTFMDDGSSLIYDNNGYNTTNSQGHRFGVRLDHKFSENTSILFEPQFNFGSGNFNEYSDFSTVTVGEDGTRSDTNRGFNENTGLNNNWSTSGFLLFRQRLGKAGRTLSFNLNYNYSNNDLTGFNQSYTDNDFTVTGDEEVVNQRYDQNSQSTSFGGRLVYTEPLMEHLFLELNYSYNWSRSTSRKDTYDSGSNPSASEVESGHLNYNSNGETYSDAYSNSISNTGQSHSAGVNFAWQKDKIRAQLGASLRPTITDNVTNGETYHSNVLNWSPQMMFTYDPNDNTNFRLFYFGRSSQPSTSQLMPVADNSDPLNVSFGNPYLEPYFNHNVRGMFGFTNKETFSSLNGRLGASIVQDGITNAIWYDANGAQYSMPLNGPTSWNSDIRVMFNSPIAKSKFSIFTMTYFRYSQSMSYVGKSSMGDILNDSYYDPSTGVLDYESFHNDFFGDGSASGHKDLLDYFTESDTKGLSFNQRVRFTFRNDFVEINVGGRTRMNKSWYSIASYNQSATWSNQVDLSMNWTIPGGISIIADTDYNWYNGYTTPQEDEIVVNAEITKLLFKNKFTLALKAYDIFNQAKNLSVTDASNYHLETRNNTLGRYIILSLTYRFGNFGGGNMGGGRGPMGPPPRR